MNGKNRDAYRNRLYRSIKIAPTTRAIRSALALSATLLALSGSGAAFAQSCVPAVPGVGATVTCTGDFTNSVDNYFTDNTDITVILDDSTTVNPFAGDTGLTADWAGDVTVISYAEINTTGNDGIYAYGTDTATLVNYGSIETTVTGAGQNGIYVGAVNDASIAIYGDVTATTAGAFAVTAVDAYSVAGDASVTVAYGGSVVADGGTGTTFGIISFAGDGDATIDNAGDVYAQSAGTVTAAYAGTKYGAAIVTNSGYIEAVSTAGAATGVYVYSYNAFDAATGVVGVYNSGTITATGDTYGTGIYTTSKYGPVVVDNNGGTIVATGYDAAVGINAGNKYSDVTVTNSGDIAAYSYDLAIGIQANTKYSLDGDILVDNSGSVLAVSYNSAAGVLALTELGNGGDIGIDNSGYIGAYSLYGVATGIAVVAYGDGDVAVDNSGSITAVSYGFVASGINVYAPYSNVAIDNSGSIQVSGYYLATGVYAYSYFGNVDVTNGGTIDVYAGGTGYYATGIDVYSGQGDVYVGNGGSITVVGYSGGTFGSYAYGIDAHTYSGNLVVDNSGSIDVTAGSYSLLYSQAYGIYATSFSGDVAVDNSGTIDVLAYSDNVYYGPQAYGVVAYSTFGDVDVVNTGSITATARADFYSFLYGITVAAGVQAISGYGDVNVANSGTISADASAYYGSADATGIDAFGLFGSITVYNDAGSVSATATTGDANAYMLASATGVNAVSYYVGDVAVHNDADISASAGTGADTYFSAAIAVGVLVEANDGDASVYNTGGITATASAGDGDLAYDNQADAYGVIAYSYAGNVYVYNDGDVDASASSGGDEGHSNAIGIVASLAVGSAGQIEIVNSGSISATAYDNATGLQLYGGYAHVVNSGSIYAYAEYLGYGVAIESTGLDTVIDNYGEVTGAILTAAGYDVLYNYDGGVWNAVGVSYLGVSDDAIWNYDGATINMTDAVIDLGLPGAGGNQFYNYGLVTVSGDNAIYMGAGNQNAFYNYGVIDFQDGEADDYLLIVGDFAGDGDINVDVSGLAGTSDVLYIDGSVVDGSVGTINVDVLDLPNDGSALIPIVYVSEDSSAGDFVLGDVGFDPDQSFLAVDFELVADIDASNATPDVFALGIEVTGLSDAGTLAASLAPSMLGLVNSQVGTWRQRMGVIDSFRSHALSLWARVFRDKGSFTPEHAAVNFGPGGNFDWHQTNSGFEAGADVAVSEAFSVGALVGQSEADTHLEDGVGSAEMEADSYGLYATWISNGWYLDASYRWTDFEFDTSSVMGKAQGYGDARTFNLEAGYAWTTGSGLKIEPQIQWTHTRIDDLTVLMSGSGMSFEADELESSRGRLGLSLRKDFGDPDAGWMWTPYVTLSAVREFEGEAGYLINGNFEGGTDVGGSSGMVELGFNARTGNVAVYGGLTWQDGGAMNSLFGGHLGVRYTFGGAAPAPAPVAAPAPKTCAELDDDGDGINNCDDRCPGSTAGSPVGADGCPVPPAPEPEPVMEPKPYRG